MLKLDTCLHSNVSSERTEILAGHLTERYSEAQRSLDTCLLGPTDRRHVPRLKKQDLFIEDPGREEVEADIR